MLKQPTMKMETELTTTGKVENPIFNKNRSFGDGYNSSTVTTTHSYSNPGVYTVRLEVFDNWGAYAFLEQVLSTFYLFLFFKQITVRARTSIQPYSTVLSGQIYQSFYTQLGSVQPGAEIRYSLDGTDPTQCSSLYNGPSLFIAFYPNVNGLSCLLID